MTGRSVTAALVIVAVACASRRPELAAPHIVAPLDASVDAPVADLGPEATVATYACEPRSPAMDCPSWAPDPGAPACERALAEATRLQQSQGWTGCVEAAIGALTPEAGTTCAFALARVGAACALRARAALNLTRGSRPSRPAWMERETGLYRALACTTPESAPERAQAEYWIGRVAMEADHFAESAPWFAHVAMSHPDHEVAGYAAALWLDALNMAASEAHADAARCYAEIGRAAAAQSEVYCRARRSRYADHCAILERIRAQVARIDAGAP